MTQTKRHEVVLIAGDGIGPEITSAAVRVLEASGAPLDFQPRDAGAAAEARTGGPLPADTLSALRHCGAGLKGPLIVLPHSPSVRAGDPPRAYATANAALRGECQAFANVRPAKRYPGVPGRFADVPVDLVLVREVSEGIYSGQERRTGPGRAEAVKTVSAEASERITRFAFDLAGREGRRKVTAVHKANVLSLTDGLFLGKFSEVAGEYPEIAAGDIMVDAAAARLVLEPESFDVIVALNQYGDILSDLAAAIVGGLGLGPGGNYGEHVAYFEACHGAAPDIAGRGIANPIAMILSGAMLLDHLQEDTAARRVREGVARFLERAEGLTPDLGGSGTTNGVAEAICRLM